MKQQCGALAMQHATHDGSTGTGLSDLDVAVHGDGEVHAEEGVLEVRHGVNEALERNIVAVHVQALEREHHEILAEAKVVRDAVSVQTGAVDHMAGFHRAMVRSHNTSLADTALGRAAHVLGAEDKANSRVLCVFRQAAGHLGRIGSGGGWRPQRNLVGLDKGLKLLGLGARDLFKRHAIRVSAPFQLVDACGLREPDAHLKQQHGASIMVGSAP